MIELRRNPKTGIVEGWENGKKTGEIITMGDYLPEFQEKDDESFDEGTNASQNKKEDYA